MKSFQEISSTYSQLRLDKIIIQPQQYLAHSRDNFAEHETLIEHSVLVRKYFLEKVELFELEVNINTIIRACLNFWPSGMAKDFDPEFVKLLFYHTIEYHDIGKINPNFQFKKLKNPLFKTRLHSKSLKTDHSKLSAFIFECIFVNEYLSKYNAKPEAAFYIVIKAFAYVIAKHHGELNGLLDDTLRYLLDDDSDEYADFLKELDVTISEKVIDIVMQPPSEIHRTRDYLNEPFFLLIRVATSLLTACDYLATNEFVSKITITTESDLFENLKKKFIKNVYDLDYNKSLLISETDVQSIKPELLLTNSLENINKLRTRLAYEVANNTKENLNSNLFYIEAPTGGGKTNLSLIALAELLKNKNTIGKLFYVLPFNTIATQVAKTLRSSLALEDNELVIMNSKSDYNFKTADEDYDSAKKAYLKYLFDDFPVTITSHVNFFSRLTSNDKQSTYLSAGLSNAVVIIDEMQAYPPALWDKISFFISFYSKYLNTKFIIMSATLPKIGHLTREKNGIDEYVSLVPNSEVYFNNNNFRNRVEFDLSMLNDSVENFSNIAFLQIVNEKLDDEGYPDKVIIEFLTKKRATEVFKIIRDIESFDQYQVLLISGTILEHRRREIVRILSEESSNKYLVVCTQVIEAGVDIDMDIGFKDVSMPDMEEQFAGRINRNARKKRSKVFLFQTGDSKNVYKKDYRTLANITINERGEILISKNFNKYYAKVFEKIDKRNSNELFTKTLTDLQNQVRELNFSQSSNMLKLIEDSQATIFVPIQILANNFSLHQQEIIAQWLGIELANLEHVDGGVIWEIYDSVLTQKKASTDFIKTTADIKSLQSIISMFTFSIFKTKPVEDELSRYCKNGGTIHGYWVLENHENVYTVEEGLTFPSSEECMIL